MCAWHPGTSGLGEPCSRPMSNTPNSRHPCTLVWASSAPTSVLMPTAGSGQMPSARALSRSDTVANARPISNRSDNAAPSASNNATALSPTSFPMTAIASRAACWHAARCVAVGGRHCHKVRVKGPSRAGSVARVGTSQRLWGGHAGDTSPSAPFANR